MAIAVADVVNMLQYSVYSVISPEGCASILWKDAGRASDAAMALGLTADRLRDLGLVDKVLSEPLGGAHRDPHLMGATLKKALTDQMRQFRTMQSDELVARRMERILQYGKFELLAQEAEETSQATNESTQGATKEDNAEEHR